MTAAANVELLGGPVINAIGLVIASRQKGWILVLSAEIILRVSTS